MANYSAIKATVNAYIKANGKKEITGHILNSVLNATIDSLGRYFQFAGGALPTDDPGTPDQNVCYLAGEPGVYTNFGGITIENEEVALLFWNGEWTKQRVLLGIQEVEASVDNQVGTPSVDVSYSGGQLVLTFHNLKGEQGEAAGFGTIEADITGGVGTPGVSVETSGDNTAKNIMFHFTNLKGETGVTSVIATIDNTSGTPACQVSLVNGVLTLAFSGLKGLKGDTGVSADYPITIYNGLDSDATDQALAAAQGKVLDGKISQLRQEVTDISTESPEDDEEMVQVVSDDGETIYLEISEDGVDAKDLKSNGEQVLTATTGATKAELNEKQDTIPEIQSEETISQENEQIWCSDDYDGNGNGELYAKVNSDGMFAKNIKRLDGASALFSPLFGKKIRIFGGSVAFLLDKYTGGNIIRSTGAILTDDAQSGAGFANNLSLVDGAIVYGGANIQKQVDDATAVGQVKADIYILWSSTNDYTTASIQVGDNEDYTISDNFDVSKRLTQCGGINYCIKKLCEFAPEAKVVVFGSLKCFGNPGGGWTEGGCGLSGRLKALVDGQHECAMRSSLPFFSLWENSGFNEYNSNTYFYHGDDDMYYPAGHGNDGTHPNKEGYIYLANKIINFINTI